MRKNFIIKDAGKLLAEQIRNTGMIERTAMSMMVIVLSIKWIARMGLA